MNDPQSQVNPQRRTARVHVAGRELDDRQRQELERDRSMRAYRQNPRALGTNPREQRA